MLADRGIGEARVQGAKDRDACVRTRSHAADSGAIRGAAQPVGAYRGRAAAPGTMPRRSPGARYRSSHAATPITQSKSVNASANRHPSQKRRSSVLVDVSGSGITLLLFLLVYETGDCRVYLIVKVWLALRQ